MKQENTTREALKKKEASLKVLVWFFGMVLLMELGFFIYISIKNKPTPLLAIPFALSPILLLVYKNLKVVRQEIINRK